MYVAPEPSRTPKPEVQPAPSWLHMMVPPRHGDVSSSREVGFSHLSRTTFVGTPTLGTDGMDAALASTDTCSPLPSVAILTSYGAVDRLLSMSSRMVRAAGFS